MKSAVGGIVLALVLFAAGALSWREAGLARRMATAHERLATLHYDKDEGADAEASILSRVPGLGGPGSKEARRHRATVSYWLSRYDSLKEMTAATGPAAVTDSALLFVAANASFRAQAPQAADRKLAIEGLDGVIQAYADVLRRDSSFADAAYNYEFVSRMRDALAKAPVGRTAQRDRKTGGPAVSVSVDLPNGVTVHGRPGGPPEGTTMSEFKTIAPMRYDEREEQMDPGRGKEFRRKG